MAPIENMRAKTETDAALDRIESLVGNARPVPLTDQVRLNPKEAKGLIAELREALSAERRSRR
jgi:hypothetical protein